MRELRDVKKLDDRFGQFLVRVKCPACGASRDIAAEALARIVGWSISLESLAPRLRCSKCGAKGTATVTPVGLPRPRGFTGNPH
jgi:ssDNA-binding Zn-finger/Zn-ribbon topoisomerase 1